MSKLLMSSACWGDGGEMARISCTKSCSAGLRLRNYGIMVEVRDARRGHERIVVSICHKTKGRNGRVTPWFSVGEARSGKGTGSLIFGTTTEWAKMDDEAKRNKRKER